MLIKNASEAQRGDENKVFINSIRAREILDSRGNPTVEVELETEGRKFFASVPSGASKGKYEAEEIRDRGERYFGKGVLKAVKNINELIAPKLIGKDTRDQKGIDDLLDKLDGTENKSKLGANAICGVSLAVCRAGAEAKNLPLYSYIAKIYRGLTPVNLPFPCFNIINGGVHAGNDLDVQEFMLVPREKSIFDNLRIASEIYAQLKEVISKKYGNPAANLGDEGGFAPPIKSAAQAIELILEAAKKINYEKKLKLILDIASSQFFKNGKYKIENNVFTREGLMNYYLKLLNDYPILGLEDPFAEDDFEGWEKISSKFKVQSSKLLIIGDDLTVTNPKRIKEARGKNACNAIIIKINQIGTVSEALEAVKLAKSFNWKIFVKNRSGETNDDFIADFAVGVGADGIMAGAPSRGERVAKYNRLLKVEEELHNN